MPTIDSVLNRIACNASSRDPALDVISGEPLQLFKGVDAKIHCALFSGPPSADTYITDVSNIDSINLILRVNDKSGAVLFTQQSSVAVASTYAAWIARTGQQFTFTLSTSATTQNVPSDGTLLVFFDILVTLNSGAKYIAAYGYGEIVDVGVTNLGPPVDSAYVPVITDITGLVFNDDMNFPNVTTLTEVPFNKTTPGSRRFIEIDTTTAGALVHDSNGDDVTTASPTTPEAWGALDLSAGDIYGARVILQGGGTGNANNFIAGEFHTLMDRDTTGSGSGPDTLVVTTDTNQVTTNRLRSIVNQIALDGTAVTAVGLTNIIRTVGAAANYNSAILQLNDIFNGSTSVIQNPILFQGKIRGGLGVISGVARGISIEGWSAGTVPCAESYAIKIDATVDIGTLRYAIHSLALSPSLFSGPVIVTVLKVGSNQVVGARDTGWTAMTGSPDKATAYATGSVTLPQLAGRVAALQAALTTHGLLGT